jgi:hypothetical protein
MDRDGGVRADESPQQSWWSLLRTIPAFILAVAILTAFFAVLNGVSARAAFARLVMTALLLVPYNLYLIRRHKVE